jgi:hypothetical protein
VAEKLGCLSASVNESQAWTRSWQPHFSQPLWLQTPLAPAQCIGLTHPAYVDGRSSGV